MGLRSTSRGLNQMSLRAHKTVQTGMSPAHADLGAPQRAVASPAPAWTTLTRREIEVMATFVECETVALTASALEISAQTVRNHLTAIYRKLAVTNRLGALKAVGWLSSPPYPHPHATAIGH
jgi:DNA-binding CsgD family transcriptional regulator